MTAVFSEARRFSEVEVATEISGKILDLLDNARRRVPWLDRDADYPPAPRLDDVAADDRIFGLVRAFDENVRLDRLNQVFWGFFVKDHDAVDARQRLEDFRAFPLRGDGTT